MEAKEIIKNLVKAYNLLDVEPTGETTTRIVVKQNLTEAMLRVQKTLLVYRKQLIYKPGKGFIAINKK